MMLQTQRKISCQSRRPEKREKAHLFSMFFGRFGWNFQILNNLNQLRCLMKRIEEQRSLQLTEGLYFVYEIHPLEGSLAISFASFIIHMTEAAINRRSRRGRATRRTSETFQFNCTHIYSLISPRLCRKASDVTANKVEINKN